jgi:hypothetical protein
MKMLTDNLVYPPLANPRPIFVSLLTSNFSLPRFYTHKLKMPNEPNFQTSRLTVSHDMKETYNDNQPKKYKKKQTLSKPDANPNQTLSKPTPNPIFPPVCVSSRLFISLPHHSSQACVDTRLQNRTEIQSIFNNCNTDKPRYNSFTESIT